MGNFEVFILKRILLQTEVITTALEESKIPWRPKRAGKRGNGVKRKQWSFRLLLTLNWLLQFLRLGKFHDIGNELYYALFIESRPHTGCSKTVTQGVLHFSYRVCHTQWISESLRKHSPEERDQRKNPVPGLPWEWHEQEQIQHEFKEKRPEPGT